MNGGIRVVDFLDAFPRIPAFPPKHLGFEVSGAWGGKDAIKKLDCRRFDFMPTGSNMPAMDGIDLAVSGRRDSGDATGSMARLFNPAKLPRTTDRGRA